VQMPVQHQKINPGSHALNRDLILILPLPQPDLNSNRNLNHNPNPTPNSARAAMSDRCWEAPGRPLPRCR